MDISKNVELRKKGITRWFHKLRKNLDKNSIYFRQRKSKTNKKKCWSSTTYVNKIKFVSALSIKLPIYSNKLRKTKVVSENSLSVWEALNGSDNIK
jgi:hypothetical protein